MSRNGGGPGHLFPTCYATAAETFRVGRTLICVSVDSERADVGDRGDIGCGLLRDAVSLAACPTNPSILKCRRSLLWDINKMTRIQYTCINIFCCSFNFFMFVLFLPANILIGLKEGNLTFYKYIFMRFYSTKNMDTTSVYLLICETL